MIIVVEFNQVRCGVLVDSVEMIHRCAGMKSNAVGLFDQSGGADHGSAR
jgi:chemotaxis signal transduction protein